MYDVRALWFKGIRTERSLPKPPLIRLSPALSAGLFFLELIAVFRRSGTVEDHNDAYLHREGLEGVSPVFCVSADRLVTNAEVSDFISVTLTYGIELCWAAGRIVLSPQQIADAPSIIANFVSHNETGQGRRPKK
jgi:hypothetical protein